MDNNKDMQAAWRQFIQTGSVQDYLHFCTVEHNTAPQGAGGENGVCASKPRV